LQPVDGSAKTGDVRMLNPSVFGILILSPHSSTPDSFGWPNRIYPAESDT
jgi:hypothetical protein